jgi:hypothetical protein
MIAFAALMIKLIDYLDKRKQPPPNHGTAAIFIPK